MSFTAEMLVDDDYMATFFESKHVPFNLSICDGHDSVLCVHLCVYILANSSFDLFFLI